MPETFTLPTEYWGKTKSSEIETIIIQLGRVGDLLNILPVAKAMFKKTGRRTRIVTHRSNANILARAPYCDPIIWDGDPSDGLGASRMAQKLPFDHPGIKVVSCMFFGNLIHGGKHHRNFLIEQWGILGYDKEWGRLPLELDRDPIWEESVGKACCATGDYVVLSLESYSSPCPVKEQIKAMVLAACDGMKVIDVSNFKTANFVDMLGLLENAKALVTVDSALIHLNRVTRTPAILFGKGIENKWHLSYNVENVSRFWTYEDFTRNGVDTIKEAGLWLNGLIQNPSYSPIVVTGGDDNFRKLSTLCRQSLNAAGVSRVIEFCPLPELKGKAPSWWKLRAVLDVLDSVKDNEWVMWIDADCVVRKGRFNPPLSGCDFVTSQDWNGACLGVFACRNTPFVKGLLNALMLIGDSRQQQNIHGKNDGPKWEQDAFKTLRAFFPDIEQRTGFLPVSWTTDHPQDDPEFNIPIHHWGGRPLNVRHAGMTKDIGVTVQELLITFCYLPPRGIGNNDWFLSNLTDWEAHHRVVLLSDSLEWEPNRVIPKIVPEKNHYETSVPIFDQVILAAEDYGSEYFMVIEPDCRIKGDWWDNKIMGHRGFLVSGTPVAFNTDINGDELKRKTNEILNRSSVKIKPLHDEWIKPNQWALFPNGAFAVYKTKETVEAWRDADRSLPWDMAIGMSLARRNPDYLERFSVNGGVLSFNGEIWMKRDEMKRELNSGRVWGIHNIKDDWKPTK